MPLFPRFSLSQRVYTPSTNGGLWGVLIPCPCSRCIATGDAIEPVVVADEGITTLLLPFASNGEVIGRAIASQYATVIDLHAHVYLSKGRGMGLTTNGKSHDRMLLIEMGEVETGHQPQRGLLVMVMGKRDLDPLLQISDRAAPCLGNENGTDPTAPVHAAVGWVHYFLFHGLGVCI